MKLCSCPRKQNSKTPVLVVGFLLNNLILCKWLTSISLSHWLQPRVLLTMIYKRTSKDPQKNKFLPQPQSTKNIISTLIWRRGCSQPQEATICLEHKRRWCSMKHEQPKNPIISFLTPITCQFQATTYAKYDDIEGKVKTEQTRNSFFLSGLPYSSVSQTQNVGRILMY